MAGYEDTRQKIISTLMGRPVGTEIQPENHQDYALNMLDYIRSLELIATSTLIGIAESDTVPVQPNGSRTCYIAGVAQNQTVVFENFIDENGNPISVTTGDMEGVFIILLWNTQYWSAQTFSTNIISQSESATFYYRYNIRKTYASVALMNADVASPIGTDGKYIKVGDIVTVVNSTTPSENGVYSYEGATDGWKYQSSFNFQLEQIRSQNTNTAPSSKLFDDKINELAGDIIQVETDLNQTITALEQEQIQGGVYDVSSHNDGAVFESISTLLGSANLSTLIPSSVRRGGMSIRFIQGSVPNSDNKYVQWRLVSKNWNIDTNNWVAENEDFRSEVMREVNEAIDSIQPIEITGDVTNAPDEEDLTRVNVGMTDVLKFKDKVYNPFAYSGLGKKILRKNIVNGVNTLTQDMFNKGEVGSRVPNGNTIFVIQYDYDLNGQTINIPSNCVLSFDGGKIINGTIEHNNCAIISSTTCFEDIIFSSTYNKQINAMWFGVLPSNSSNASILNKLFTFCINVFLPVGVYNIEDELILDGEIRQFHGSVDVSRKLTKLNFSSTNGFVVKIKCSISNFVVLGNNCIGTYDASQGIYLDGKLGIDVRKGCFIDNCVVSNFMVGLNIVSEHIITGRFNNIVVQENSNYGLCLVHTDTEQKNNLSFNLIYAVNNGYDAKNSKSDSTLEVSGIGIYIKGGYANSFTNCVCEYNSGVGLLVASPSGENILSGNLFSTIYTERNKYANIIIYVTNAGGNRTVRNNVFKSLFYSDANQAPVSNANENRGIIIKPNNLMVGIAYDAIYASFEINNISNKLIADYVSQMGVDIDLLGRMGITEDEDIVIKKDAKGYYIDLSSKKKSINKIGVLSLLKFKRGIYRIFVAAQSYNITSTNPSIYFGLTINGTLSGQSRQISSTEDFVTNLGVYYLPQENNNITINNNYIDNVSSLPSDFNIRLRKIYFEEIKSLTSAERNSITLDSNMVGYRVFDSTLGKDVVWSGSKWRNPDGTEAIN